MTETKHKSVYSALLAAQKNFLAPKKNAENTHFKNKYADLRAVVDAVMPALNEQGIVFYHVPSVTELGSFMTTILHHPESDTKLEAPVEMLIGKRDSQGYKAASTYAKRIGLECVTGVAASDDDDAETERQSNTMGAALRDAWRQSVEDSLPENATPRQRADAYADAICADFAGKGEKALQNRWDKHKAIIAQFETRFPDLHEKVVDAYENRMLEIGNVRTAAE